MDTARVVKIRPVSWKIYVQGAEQARHVRRVLNQVKIETTELQSEPSLIDPPVLSFMATAPEHSPFTQEELEAILQQGGIELEFDEH